MEEEKKGGEHKMLRLRTEELIEINDFYNSASQIIITYISDNLVLLELLYKEGEIEEFLLSKRDLIMILRNFYVEDICDIVQSGVYNDLEIKVDESIKYYPVQISLEDGHKYYCNLEELDYINKLINSQKVRNK